MSQKSSYWDRHIFGIPLFKIQYITQRLLYRFFNVKLPKFKDQKRYWNLRGYEYMSDIVDSGYGDRELFFQNLLIGELKKIEFSSFFEAGCGFGWNVRRVKDEFPCVKVGGIDFSVPQLKNAEKYMNGLEYDFVQGDICNMPFEANQYDIGFSMGVFMNIHENNIETAAREMMRVCRQYIIHLEYDEENTTDSLREKRAFKQNIISHNYRKIYEKLGAKVIKFETFENFGRDYKKFMDLITSDVAKWEGFEGEGKYILIVLSVD